MGDNFHQSKGKQPRSSSKAPKFKLSEKGSEIPMIVRR